MAKPISLAPLASKSDPHPDESERVQENTREQLLLAAERLFARDGTAGVSLRAIARAAGQRNTGAVHYYFGSREGVIEAIFEARAAVIDDARTRALKRIPAQANAQDRVRAVIAAIVKPFAGEGSAGQSENHYPRFVAQLIQGNDDTAHRIWQGRFSRSIELAYTMLADILPELPEPILQHRFATMFRLAIHSVSDLDQEMRRSPSAASSAKQRRLQLENLVDMLAAGFAGAPSKAVARAARDGTLRCPTHPSSLSNILGKTTPIGRSG